MTPAAPHPGLAWLAADPAGREWLRALPDLVDGCATRWQLTPGEPFPDASTSLVLPATDRAGAAVVLKVQFPHRESELEGEALRLWDGEGAVRLLDEDRSRHALLLERCVPGTALAAEVPGRALDVMVELLPRLWRPAPTGAHASQFRTAAEEAAGWAARLPARWEAGGRRVGRDVLDRVLELLAVLPLTQGEQVLLHQDLHGGNVLRAQRGQWLAIDPKPLVGERELGLAPVIRSHELGPGRDHLRRRLDRLVGELGLDRERSIGWALVQTVVWGASGHVPPEHEPVPGWLLELLSAV